MVLRATINRTDKTEYLLIAFAPVLLARKAKQIRANMDPEKGSQREVRTVFDRPDRQ